MSVPVDPRGAPREPLAEALHRAAARLRTLDPPDPLLGALQRELARQPASGRPRDRDRPRDRSASTPAPARRWRLSPAAAACVAALLLSTVLLLFGAGPPPQPASALAGPPAGFITVVGPDRWEQLVVRGDGRAWLVATELPQDRLAALGLPYDPSRAGERVPAEVLMHASGDVLAVRLRHDRPAVR